MVGHAAEIGSELLLVAAAGNAARFTVFHSSPTGLPLRRPPRKAWGMPPLNSSDVMGPPDRLDPAGRNRSPRAVACRPDPVTAVTSTGGALFHAGELFSSGELQAMLLDGLLRRVYRDSYLRADFQEDSACRAVSALRSVPGHLRSRVALGRQCAAWVYGCAPPPMVVSLLTDHRRRTTTLPLCAHTTLHQVSLGPFDVNLIGGVAVTTPLRTALDIAVHGPPEHAVRILRSIASDQSLECPLRLVEAALVHTARVPGKSRALGRLREAQSA